MTMHTTVRAICVWQDTLSDPEHPAWIVSRDRIRLPRGEAEETHTLHVCEDEKTAIYQARLEAKSRGLPLYRNNEDSPAELID